MNIVFMGTPDFAVPSLQALIDSEKHTVLGVYTQPDKPVGRKRVITSPAVKQLALRYDINVYQPATLKNEHEIKILKSLNPDVIVVIAYGKILPQAVLEIPKHGCVNIHGSLLPKLRGAAPIQRSVLNGDSETGVTSMLMNEGIDTGDMLVTEKVKILPDETAGELFDRLAPIGAEVLLKTLDEIENGTVERKPQDDSISTHAAMLSKDEAAIDWRLSNRDIHNKVRGLNPWPVAITEYGGKKVKIFKTRLCDKSGVPGSIISVNPPTVACGSGSVELLEVQLEGKNKMSAEEFFRGRRISEGDTFNDEK